MFHCGVPEKGKNGQVDVWISVKLCMKAWWLHQGSWHRIRWTAASQDWKIRPASREGSGSCYHLQRIKIQIFQPGQVRETCTDPICTMSKIRTSAWQKPAFLFASNSFAAKYLHCINADWAPVGVEQLYSVVNEGQFGGSPGFTSPRWLCPEVTVGLRRELRMQKVVLSCRKMSGPHRVSFSPLDILIQRITGFF